MRLETIPAPPAAEEKTSRFILQGDRSPPGSLYLHVPFCFHKCHYCDFYSFVDTQDRQEPYLDALSAELRRIFDVPRAREVPLRTIFVGGGTPTLLRADLWDRLLSSLHALALLDPSTEFTVECNPETVTPELMSLLARGGVNRVSIGAQSFERRHLSTLERWHDPENVERALRLAAEAGIMRRSVDLIFGVPGQTLDDWRADLERIVSMRVSGDESAVEHLSCYALTYEPNTAMTARLERGEFQPVEETLEVQMQQLTVEMLRSAGMERYEVSNFARPGAECRHNLVYWRGEEWCAAGPSASGHLAGHRWKNIPHLAQWMAGVARHEGFSPIVDHEAPDAARAVRERLMLGLRLGEGVDAAVMTQSAEHARPGSAKKLHDAAIRQVKAGLLRMEDGRWRLTDRGFLFADGVASELMAACQ